MRWTAPFVVVSIALAYIVIGIKAPEASPMQILRYKVAGTTHKELPLLPAFSDQSAWAGQFKALMAMASKVTCWVYADGEIELETPRIPGETEQAQCDRHEAGEAAVLQEFGELEECD